MNHREIVAAEGWAFIALPALLALLCFILSWKIAGIIWAGLSLFCLFFFRNPERTIPEGVGLVVSPADGRVMDVARIEEPLFIKGEAIRIRIFLNLFNVHINRMPVEGTVECILGMSIPIPMKVHTGGAVVMILPLDQIIKV